MVATVTIDQLPLLPPLVGGELCVALGGGVMGVLTPQMTKDWLQASGMAFAGAVTAPTPVAGDSSLAVATTAFVGSAVAVAVAAGTKGSQEFVANTVEYFLAPTAPVTQSITLAVGTYTLSCGAGGTAVLTATTAALVGAGTAADLAPVTFSVTAPGVVLVSLVGALAVVNCRSNVLVVPAGVTKIIVSSMDGGAGGAGGGGGGSVGAAGGLTTLGTLLAGRHGVQSFNVVPGTVYPVTVGAGGAGGTGGVDSFTGLGGGVGGAGGAAGGAKGLPGVWVGNAGGGRGGDAGSPGEASPAFGTGGGGGGGGYLFIQW